MRAEYLVERWEHGWLVCSAPGGHGIPMDAMSELMGLFSKGAVMDAAIVHHFRASGKRDVCVCVVDKAGSRRWRAEIEQSLAGLSPQARWWRGLDCGASSASIFAVFCDESLRFEARECGTGSTPRDADDFGRCVRLLSMFPEWKSRLSEVAAAYPGSKWDAIIARWDEIASAPRDQQNAILSEIDSR